MSDFSKKPSGKFMNFGYSSILLALVMICILTFSTLSFFTVRSNYELTRKTAEKNIQYYQAEKTAYGILDEIDACLEENYKNETEESSYYSAIENTLNQGNGTLVQDENIWYYTYEVTVSEKQNLLVKLKLNYPKETGQAFYQMESWRLVNIQKLDLK